MGGVFAIELEGISKRYRLGEYNARTLWESLKYRRQRNGSVPQEVWALREVSLRIRPGEMVGIIGPNGAGKSTLLKVVSRITYPTYGTVRWRGRIASLLEVGTGFHPELTGRENILLNGTILGMRRHEIRRRLDAIVDFAEVAPYLDTPVKRYSTGMVVRLAFSVAVHLEAEILLVDEVLSVGDAFFRQKAIEKMQELISRQGRTVLFVSHNMGILRNLCKRGIVLDSGRVSHDAPIDEAVAFYLATRRRQLERPLSERTDRTGSGKWRVRRVEILDARRQHVDQVLAGDPLHIRCYIDKKSAVNLRELFVGIVLWDAYHTKAATFFSDEMAADFSFLQQADAFELYIPRLNLRPGRFGIGIHLGEGGAGPQMLLDYIEEAASVMVLPGDFWGTGRAPRPHGIALLPAEFRP